MSNEQHGVIVLNKPAGMTSHDCVARIRRIMQTKKVGHTGTLDPDVTGVLPICVNHATRIVEYLQELPKAYEVVMRLGSSTTTEDASGEVIEKKEVDPAHITTERVREAFQNFNGPIEQIPPMFSAIKVQGKRLYDLAREGIEIERKARQVTIYELKLHEINPGDGYIDVSFYCLCSKGTYMRTLCVDLGKDLGYPAHMDHLLRVKSGPFTLDQAVTLEWLEQQVKEGTTDFIIPIGEALSYLPRYQVPKERVAAVRNGLETGLVNCQAEEGQLICLYDEEQILGIHKVHKGPRGFFAKPEKVFRT
ncbi:tRNA pseudouridine(55) synthase TruB [Brevibacillus daliensis]|uniref:tRNA pseudouridine(55) synthase TruB n=1 Tax=Brevibacillus daliensis TaxID=2892995 RepID=UPI001E4797AF|nr:tRNA pseudouridine(55) synthase TruB [Brevibacillus daliensis]